MVSGPGQHVNIYDRAQPGSNGHVIMEIDGQFCESGGMAGSCAGGGGSRRSASRRIRTGDVRHVPSPGRALAGFLVSRLAPSVAFDRRSALETAYRGGGGGAAIGSREDSHDPVRNVKESHPRRDFGHISM